MATCELQNQCCDPTSEESFEGIQIYKNDPDLAKCKSDVSGKYKNGIVTHTLNGIDSSIVQDGCSSNENQGTNDVRCDDTLENETPVSGTCLCDPKNKNICEGYTTSQIDERTSCITSTINKLCLSEDSERDSVIDGIHYVVYESELQMPDIMRLITKDLSEPYSIYTYRYFIHNWPKLCFLVSMPSLLAFIMILIR